MKFKDFDSAKFDFASIWGCRDGSVVRNAYWSASRPEFGSQSP